MCPLAGGRRLLWQPMHAVPCGQAPCVQVVTLWHEFGHALNSLLSRTALQHFSGGPLRWGAGLVLEAPELSGPMYMHTRLCALRRCPAAPATPLPVIAMRHAAAARAEATAGGWAWADRLRVRPAQARGAPWTLSSCPATSGRSLPAARTSCRRALPSSRVHLQSSCAAWLCPSQGPVGCDAVPGCWLSCRALWLLRGAGSCLNGSCPGRALPATALARPCRAPWRSAWKLPGGSPRSWSSTSRRGWAPFHVHAGLQPRRSIPPTSLPAA